MNTFRTILSSSSKQMAVPQWCKSARNGAWVPGIRLTHQRSSSNPTKLFRRNSTIHLLGTMHIAEASAVAARHLIQHEHAKGTLGGVFLELDSPRFQRLRDLQNQQADESMFSHAMSILSRPSQNPVASIVELAFTTMYRTLHRLGFGSGVEFKAAIEVAERHNIPIVLGDQHVQTTLRRLADGFGKDFDLPRLMSIVLSQASKTARPETDTERKIRLAFQSIAQGDVTQAQERLAKLIDQESVREIMRPMQKYAPNVTNAILHERDVVMAENLISAADNLPPGKNSIVAIVGLAHMDGICSEWQKRNMIKEYQSSDRS